MVYLRAKGYVVPQNPKIAAKTLPATPGLPPEGEVVVAVTYEGPVGHVRAVKNVDGKLVKVDDSLGDKGKVDMASYKGWIAQPHLKEKNEGGE